jgi:hypothetical protein
VAYQIGSFIAIQFEISKHTRPVGIHLRFASADTERALRVGIRDFVARRSCFIEAKTRRYARPPIGGIAPRAKL